jgi:hypothetical protein
MSFLHGFLDFLPLACFRQRGQEVYVCFRLAFEKTGIDLLSTISKSRVFAMYIAFPLSLYIREVRTFLPSRPRRLLARQFCLCLTLTSLSVGSGSCAHLPATSQQAARLALCHYVQVDLHKQIVWPLTLLTVTGAMLLSPLSSCFSEPL